MRSKDSNVSVLNFVFVLELVSKEYLFQKNLGAQLSKLPLSEDD